MSEYTDELLDPISENLTNQLELFLANTNLDHSQKKLLVQTINLTFIEGHQYGQNKFYEPSYSKNGDTLEKREAEFMRKFHEKLNGKSEGDN